MKFNYIIIDDHQLFTEALELLLSKIPQLIFCGSFQNGNDAENFIQRIKPDLCILDLQMPGKNGMQLIGEFRQQFPRMAILVVSMVHDPLVIAKAFDQGAHGFVPKNTSFEQINLAIQNLLKGGTYLSEEYRKEVEKLKNLHQSNEPLASLKQGHTLSEREIEILKLVAKGLTSELIADQLCLSPLTVKTHRRNINQKLGVKNTAAVISFCNELGII